MCSPFEGQILPVRAAVRRIACPHPRPERDALIAATALTHALTVVTRNVRDFEPMGTPLLNPWLATASDLVQTHLWQSRPKVALTRRTAVTS
jgi:hypothetical protein